MPHPGCTLASAAYNSQQGQINRFMFAVSAHWRTSRWVRASTVSLLRRSSRLVAVALLSHTAACASRRTRARAFVEVLLSDSPSRRVGPCNLESHWPALALWSPWGESTFAAMIRIRCAAYVPIRAPFFLVHAAAPGHRFCHAQFLCTS